MSTTRPVSRRSFLASTGKGAAAASLIGAAPAIVPATVFGKTSPGNRINVAAIGTGRISRDHDMPDTLAFDSARIMAVCDLDRHGSRTASASSTTSTRSSPVAPYDGVTMYDDYRELLANRDIDAVLISTPDHWHAPLAIAAVEAGKDVYLQKPASLTIAEGRALSYAVQRTGRVLQLGSQNRSLPQHRYACELVRNGRIGQLKTIEVGLAADPAGQDEPAMPVPPHFNYDMWLGSTPQVAYTEKRVHPQVGYERPGWLRCEQFGAGMITGWGAHHIDTAHWGMDAEHTGPVEIWGKAEFPKSGIWDVHGAFRTEARYADGVHMIVSDSIHERREVHRHRGLDLRQPGERTERQRAGRLRRQPEGARRERPEDPDLDHRPRRNSPHRQQGPSRQLAGGDSFARPPAGAGRSRASVLLGVPAAPHGDACRPHAQMGSRARALPQRRRGQLLALAPAAASVRVHVGTGTGTGRSTADCPGRSCGRPEPRAEATGRRRKRVSVKR